MADLAELTTRFDEASAKREHAEAALRAASTRAEHYAALLALQRAESARSRALYALTSAKVGPSPVSGSRREDGIDTWNRWCVHAHKGTTCDRESFMCVEAHSSEGAALQAVTSYWNDAPEDLFDYTDPAEPRITVVVYELPQPDERSGSLPQDWVGTVTREHPDDDEVTIWVETT